MQDRVPSFPPSVPPAITGYPSLPGLPPHPHQTRPGRLCDAGGMPHAFTQEGFLVATVFPVYNPWGTLPQIGRIKVTECITESIHISTSMFRSLGKRQLCEGFTEIIHTSESRSRSLRKQRTLIPQQVGSDLSENGPELRIRQLCEATLRSRQNVQPLQEIRNVTQQDRQKWVVQFNQPRDRKRRIKSWSCPGGTPWSCPGPA